MSCPLSATSCESGCRTRPAGSIRGGHSFSGSSLQERVELLGLGRGKTVGTAGTISSTRRDDGTSHLDAASQRNNRRVVGKLLWLSPLRPGLSYVSKGLSRTLHSRRRRVTMPSWSMPSCTGREHHRMSIHSNVDTTYEDNFDVATITLRGIALHHDSRTQTTVAQPSGETELYGLNSGTTETVAHYSSRESARSIPTATSPWPRTPLQGSVWHLD